MDEMDYRSAAARSAIKHLNATERFERAAQEICGPNAAWAVTGPNEIQCFTNKGRKTITAKL
jgi:hypothetical protein